MLAELGKRGYVAVDSGNTIVVSACSGSFVKYDLETEKGKVHISRGYYQYENGQVRNRSTAVYLADAWQYTEEGYHIWWYSERLSVEAWKEIYEEKEERTKGFR